MSTAIDMHTHMLSDAWVDAIKQHGGPHYSIGSVRGGQQAVHLDGAPFMTLMPGMFDYGLRIRAMDAARVDVSIVTLTCPNVCWGGRAVSLGAARAMNESMFDAQVAHAGRIRWMASLPWQYPEDAVAELKRAQAAGAVGVVTLANIAGEPLTSPKFAPVWAAIEASGLPAWIHPTAPPGADAMDMTAYNLIANIGFMFDTTLALTRMIYDGFFDRYPSLKLIAGHAGGTLPFLAGRLDQCYNNMPASRVNISQPPSAYLRHIYYDAVVYSPEALELCIAVAGADRVMYGSDYPHNIGDMAGCLARVDALPAGQRDGVRGGNAQRIFNL
jgi:aminocarboxymuconate-semialdehyde decarboxylase